MAKGRLSQTEKYVIKGMYEDGKTAEEIAAELERSVMAVENYIEGMTYNINPQEVEPEPENPTYIANLETELAHLRKQLPDPSLEGMKQTVYEKINNIPGMVEGTGYELVKRALAISGQENPPNATMLFNWAMKELKAKELMGRQTANPSVKTEKTVAIMTKAASEKSDSFRQTMPNSIARTARNNLYSISEDKIIHE